MTATRHGGGRRRGLVVGSGVALAAVLAGALWLRATAPVVPSFEDVRAAERPSDVPLLDRHGAILQVRRTDPHRRRFAWTPLADVAPVLPQAIVRAEDRRFDAHAGVDVRGLVHAVFERLAGGARRGASTISMQLATLLDPTLGTPGRRRTFAQKWRQIRAARALERTWSKDAILEAYLNRVTFRGEIEGVGAAAAVLYGKAPHGLTDVESATLAALVQAPNAAAPAVTRRARLLLASAGGPVDEAALARAVAAVSGSTTGRRTAGAGLAPHLADRLLGGATAPVRSTLDAALQRAAATALGHALEELADRHVADGAVLVADNATGEVLAYVAASGPASRARFVDTVRAPRQAGSTLKPFLYALAFERRLVTPASLLDDAPLAIAVAGGLYRPRDYDARFRGLVSVRTALAGSLNVPAVRMLGLVGVDAFVEELRALGFEGLREAGDFYGPSLALGSADVTLWQLVGAYRALANGGVAGPLVVQARAAAEATDASEASTAAVPVLSPAAAFLVADVLADRESRSVTFGLENPLATPFWSAVKTGTSKDMRDNWCVGFSRRYTVGVWVGNATGAPMHAVSGVSGAAPVWLEVMRWLHRDAPSVPPVPPPGVVAADVTPTGGVEPVRREVFLAGTVPSDTEALAPPLGEILAPVAGTVVALDPDLPPTRQRVAFAARVGDPGARWRLDGADLGPANTALFLWEPSAGRHALALVDGAARPLAVTTFEVRGGPALRRP